MPLAQTLAWAQSGKTRNDARVWGKLSCTTALILITELPSRVNKVNVEQVCLLCTFLLIVLSIHPERCKQFSLNIYIPIIPLAIVNELFHAP
jgi:hypothetical protein